MFSRASLRKDDIGGQAINNGSGDGGTERNLEAVGTVLGDTEEVGQRSGVAEVEVGLPTAHEQEPGEQLEFHK